MELIDKLIRAARRAWGHREGDPTELWRFGLYPARVDACASDGSTVDVTPDDARLTPQNKVKVRAGLPGASAVLPAGARCLIGWEGGDQAKCYAVPSWESTTPTKLVIGGSTVYLGAETGAQFVALANLVKAELDLIATKFSTHTHAVAGVTAGMASVTSAVPSVTYTASSVAAAQTKAK